jgi:hypothetical protein
MDRGAGWVRAPEGRLRVAIEPNGRLTPVPRACHGYEFYPKKGRLLRKRIIARLKISIAS